MAIRLLATYEFFDQDGRPAGMVRLPVVDYAQPDSDGRQRPRVLLLSGDDPDLAYRESCTIGATKCPPHGRQSDDARRAPAKAHSRAKRKVEELRRKAKRQAAPFSREKPKRDPGRCENERPHERATCRRRTAR
jgi:hypothetical protein